MGGIVLIRVVVYMCMAACKRTNADALRERRRERERDMICKHSSERAVCSIRQIIRYIYVRRQLMHVCPDVCVQLVR